MTLICALLFTACSPRPTPEPAPTASRPAPTVTTTALPKDGRPLLPMPDVRPDGFSDPPPGEGLSRYQQQTVTWTACGNDLQCATVLAPLDYDHPDDTAISLALAKRPATGTRRLGSLFINPGGPGGSGVDYAAGFDRAGLEEYDIVGWDPRGVGRSTPVKCFAGADLDHYYSIDTTPDDAVELQELIEDRKAFGRSCLGRSGKLLEHISTTDTVRDLDLLRGLVGDSKINYFGSSYGTRIGSLYAQLFTDHVGRMVLDGAVSLDPNPEVTQLQGFERALDHFATWCAAERCRLGADRDEVSSTIKNYLDQLDARPATVEGGRTLSQQQGVEAVFFTLYGGQQGWRALRDAMTLAVVDGNAQGMLRIADVSIRRARDGSYEQLGYAFPAIRCLDSPDDSVREAQKDQAAVSRKAPVLGPLSGADLQCPLWPVDSAPRPPRITADGAPPIIVIGTTGDPATPYENAPAMADQLKSGVLVTFNGEGHLAYDESECVRRLVQGYLVNDVVPADRSTC